jgi:hypothetical protein
MIEESKLISVSQLPNSGILGVVVTVELVTSLMALVKS